MVVAPGFDSLRAKGLAVSSKQHSVQKKGCYSSFVRSELKSRLATESATIRCALSSVALGKRQLSILGSRLRPVS